VGCQHLRLTHPLTPLKGPPGVLGRLVDLPEIVIACPCHAGGRGEIRFESNGPLEEGHCCVPAAVVQIVPPSAVGLEGLERLGLRARQRG
jgi:hypothetical protein